MTNRVGEKYITNGGYNVEIIEYLSWVNCTIKFDDGTIVKKANYGSVKKGRIKNPNRPSVYNVGYMGVGKYSNGSNIKIYNTWVSMLQRCYDKKYQANYPTYKDCTLIQFWHNFQNFAQWHEENYNPKTMKGLAFR